MQDIEKIIEEAKQLQFQGDEGFNRNELRRLFGLEGDGYGISYSPEILECVLPKAQKVMARGNKIILSSALDGALWFNAVCTAGYGHSSSSAPSVFGAIFRSRKEALSDAVAEFGDRLAGFPQNTPRDITLVETLEKWLKKIEAENGLLDPEEDIPEKDTATDEDAAPLVDANGQVLLFPASEGIPEDFEDEMRKKAKAARVQAEMKKMHADERKKKATLLAKICDREAHFAQVQDVIDEARLTSMKHPKTVWLAVDTSDNPRVTDIEEWKSILPQARIGFALYAAWKSGLRISKKRFLELLALPSEKTSDDGMTEEEYDAEQGAVLAESLEDPGDETDGILPASDDGAA